MENGSNVKARLLETSIHTFRKPVVADLFFYFKLDRLVINYHSDGNKGIDYKIIFESPRGFKLLDEGDMINYWENQFIIENWIFEIESGGWLDMEDNLGGFTSKALGFREFLITGIDNCVSVISNNEPIFIRI